MNNSFIQDGKGRGFLASVDNNNRLVTSAVNQTTFEEASAKGLGFNLNTEFVSITVGTQTPLFYFKNNEPYDVLISAWFIGLGVAGGSPTENALLKVWANPTAVSGGVSVTPQNRRVGEGRSFAFDAKKQDSGTPLLATPPSSPLLFQTQTASTRVFSEVDLTLPRGQSLLVTLTANGAQTINAYTGFSGYVNVV
jgi:hypothetical protein